MSFSDHPSIDIPAAKSPSLDVLCTERLGQIYRALDVIRICFRLDPASLLFIKRPITVELKATISDSRTRKHPSRHCIGISDHRSHRCSLITNRCDAKIKISRQQVRPIHVRVEIHQAGNHCSTRSIKHTSRAGRNAASRSDLLDPALLNQDVARSADRTAGSIYDPGVLDQHWLGDWWRVRDRPTDALFLAIG